MMIYGKETKRNIFIFFLFLVLTVSCSSRDNKSSENIKKMDEMNLKEGLYADISTGKGDIVVFLEYEKTPLTVMNFTGLAEGKIDGGQGAGKPFYDGLKFHRVVDDFMIQGGCPRGNGTGGPGYSFPDEFDSTLKHTGPGILSMANSGPNSNGSQFFITHTATPWLDGKHAVFGHVVSGQDVVNRIKAGDLIKSITILRVGEAAEKFANDQETFDAKLAELTEKEKKLTAEKLSSDEKFIDKKWPSAIKTKSGLRYIVEREGTGSASPVRGQKVCVHYQGTLLNGTLFDSSYMRGQPLEFAVGQVIEGWNEALMSMKKGEKRTLIIPPDLGYGTAGVSGVIPPSSYLVFNVELLDF